MAFLAAAQLSWAAEGKGWEWKTTTSPHFEVAHEVAFMPPGFVINLEKIHNRLRMDLSGFSPWMAKERLKLYLYKDQASYLAGEFEPPAWSNGIALVDLKAVAVPDQGSRRKLLQVIGHETTHLLFEGYWKESGKSAPPWLDEGLAMLEEGDDRDFSEWREAMAYQPPDKFLEVGRFFEITPTKDLHNTDNVSDWYVQAYGTVRFLYRGHSNLQFKSFCAQLRDGKTVKEALWLTYRYASLAKFDAAWRKWLSDPAQQKQVQVARAASASSLKTEDKVEGKPGLGLKKKGFATSGSTKTIQPMSGFKSLRD